GTTNDGPAMAYVQIRSPYVRELHKQRLRWFWGFMAATGQTAGHHRTRDVIRVEWGHFRGFLKRENKVSWRDRLANWWAGFGFVSKSWREWITLRSLSENGIDCPTAVAMGED